MNVWTRRFARRLGFLAAALVLVHQAPATADEAPEGTIGQIRDDRITESSGLALSAKHNDLAYTINDRGTHPMVYAIRLSTGAVVGVTDLQSLDVEDTESIAVDAKGTLWLGDLGDNDHERDDVAIIAFPEPGPGTHHLTSAERYPVSFPDGPVDVEGMLVHPTSGQIFLVSKNRDGLGTVYRLPSLSPGITVEAVDLGVDAPEAVTDAAFTHTGRWAVLRTNDELWVYDPQTWASVGRMDTPKLEQGESVTVERGDRTVLLGSEGKNSPIVRVALPDQPNAAEPEAGDESDGGPKGVDLDLTIPVGLVATALLVAGVIARRRLSV